MPNQPPPPLLETASHVFRDTGLLLGRVLAAWCLMIFHAWGEALAGYCHFFGPKDPWGLPQVLHTAGIPLPLAVAVTLTVLLWAIVLCFAAGLLTRVAALLLVLIAGGLALVAAADVWQELAGAYAAVGLVLFFSGAGRFSLDTLIKLSRQPKKSTGIKYKLGE